MTWVKSKEFKGGIKSLFDPYINAMRWRPYWLSGMEVSYCTSGFGVIIRRDLRPLSLLCDSPRDNLYALILKEPGYFDPSHSRRGADSAPLKISETDRWNIKCVVLVDSYDPPESIGTKKIKNIPCMTSQWRHKWRHVKNTKITKHRQNHGFSPFFQAKVAFFSNDVSKYAYTCSYSK